ncbi:YHYH protein [Aurantibacter sp.]|uniref:YHYH protein n=1 Tax=Aurantibacter sp. TaxID=2807103 RepID=UPI0032668EEB
MKRIVFCTILGLVQVFFLACNEKKEKHSHDDESHTHSSDTHSHDAKTSAGFFGAYDLEDENFGTKTKVSLTANKRLIITNALPNHTTGEFPNVGNPNTISAQDKTYEIPLNPKFTGKAEWVRTPGIALNGIKFEPQTAEVVVCESGENYRVEAIQELISMGLDSNYAHVQPTGEYHYHGTPTGVIENFDNGEDLVHIGFAFDGYPMYYSKSNAYKPSFKLVDGNRDGEDCTYANPMGSIDVAVGGHHDGSFGSDFEYVEGLGDLDECNGITIDGKYMYLVTNEFPYVGRCLMGEFAAEQHGGPPPHGKDKLRLEGRPNDKPQGNPQGRPERGPHGNEDGRPQGGPPEDRPNAGELMEEMDSNKDGKLSNEEAKGRLKESFSSIDKNSDGFISKEELMTH